MALGKVFAAKRVEIRQRLHGVRRSTGDVDPEDVRAWRRSVGLGGGRVHGRFFRVFDGERGVPAAAFAPSV